MAGSGADGGREFWGEAQSNTADPGNHERVSVIHRLVGQRGPHVRNQKNSLHGLLSQFHHVPLIPQKINQVLENNHHKNHNDSSLLPRLEKRRHALGHRCKPLLSIQKASAPFSPLSLLLATRGGTTNHQNNFKVNYWVSSPAPHFLPSQDTSQHQRCFNSKPMKHKNLETFHLGPFFRTVYLTFLESSSKTFCCTAGTFILNLPAGNFIWNPFDQTFNYNPPDQSTVWGLVPQTTPKPKWKKKRVGRPVGPIFTVF